MLTRLNSSQTNPFNTVNPISTLSSVIILLKTFTKACAKPSPKLSFLLLGFILLIGGGFLSAEGKTKSSEFWTYPGTGLLFCHESYRPSTPFFGGNAANDFIEVGDPGNAPETLGGRQVGKVDYIFDISKQHVRVWQYAAFLNNVAAHSDPYHLYDQIMSEPTTSSAALIQVYGVVENRFLVYRAIPGSENLPMKWMDFERSARVINWLENGAPQKEAGPGVTENGVYDLTKPIDDPARYLPAPYAHFRLPTEDELHKTINYQGGKEGKYSNIAKNVANAQASDSFRKKMALMQRNEKVETSPEELCFHGAYGDHCLGIPGSIEYVTPQEGSLGYYISYNLPQENRASKKETPQEEIISMPLNLRDLKNPEVSENNMLTIVVIPNDQEINIQKDTMTSELNHQASALIKELDKDTKKDVHHQ